MRLTRRRVLEALGGAALATGGALAVVRRSGYATPPARRALDASRWAVASAVAARVCAADDRGAPSADEVGVTAFVDAYVAEMPEPQKSDLSRFFDFIEQLAPTLTIRRTSRFTRLSPADQDRVLAGLEASDVPLLRGGFAGLKALLFMGYYRDPRTWAIAGYEGPTIGRPVPPWPLRVGEAPP